MQTKSVDAIIEKDRSFRIFAFFFCSWPPLRFGRAVQTVIRRLCFFFSFLFGCVGVNRWPWPHRSSFFCFVCVCVCVFSRNPNVFCFCFFSSPWISVALAATVGRIRRISRSFSFLFLFFLYFFSFTLISSDRQSDQSRSSSPLLTPPTIDPPSLFFITWPSVFVNDAQRRRKDEIKYKTFDLIRHFHLLAVGACRLLSKPGCFSDYLWLFWHLF